MALSHAEIKILFQQAKQYQTNGDALSFTRALEIYDSIIKASPEPYYYAERSRVKYSLQGVKAGLLDSAIKDIEKAIDISPDTGYYYRLRGDYRFNKIISVLHYQKDILKEISEDYRTCISKAPTDQHAWLGLISVNIVSGDFDEAISLYGQCSYYIDTNEDRLNRCLLGCIALTLAGDKVEGEDIGELNNGNEQIKGLFTYVSAVMEYLNSIYNKDSEKWNNAIHIGKLYIQHFDSWKQQARSLNHLMLYDDALNACQKALEQDPNDSEIQVLRKQILLKLNRKINTSAAFETANSINKNDKTKQIIKGKRGLVYCIAAIVVTIILLSSLASRNDSSDYSNDYISTIPSLRPRLSFAPLIIPDISIPTLGPVPTFEAIPTVSIPSFLIDPPDFPSDVPAAGDSDIEILSVTSAVAPDGYATIAIRGKPSVKYKISVIYSSGPSKASGLVTKEADSGGMVSWTWHVGPSTRAGSWQIIISGGGEKTKTYFTVTK